MLTTIGLILAAYLIQDYLISWSKRRRRCFHPKKGGVCQNLFITSLISLVIIVGIAASLAKPNQKPCIKAFLGTVYADTQPAEIYGASDYFQKNSQKSDSRPTYVFLNPGTPSNLIELPKPRHRRRPRHPHAHGLSKRQNHHDFSNKIYAKN